MENIIDEIRKKESEIFFLREKFNKLGKDKYSYLIGKFYCLAATEFIKITDINYVTENFVNVNCLRIVGGKYISGDVELSMNDDYSLDISEINNNKILEVTKEKFIEFINELLEYSKNIVLELI